MRDEDPSDDDVDRFGDDTGWCPDCGREVWDEAWQCPHCSSVIEGRIRRTSTDPVGARLSRQSVIVLVVAIVIVLLAFQIL